MCRELDLRVTPEMEASMPTYIRYGDGAADLIHIADLDERSLRKFICLWTGTFVARCERARGLRVARERRALGGGKG